MQHLFDERFDFVCVYISDGSDTQNLGFGFWKCYGEMGLRQVEHGISSFLTTFFGIFDDF